MLERSQFREVGRRQEEACHPNWHAAWQPEFCAEHISKHSRATRRQASLLSTNFQPPRVRNVRKQQQFLLMLKSNVSISISKIVTTPLLCLQRHFNHIAMTTETGPNAL